MESPDEPAGATVPPKLPRPRTTRARTSGEYLADVFFVIAPASQELEPPANPVRFMAYNLANFMRTPALPKEVEHWSLTTLREKLVKIRCESRVPWPVRHVPIGRGGGAERTVPENPDPDR